MHHKLTFESLINGIIIEKRMRHKFARSVSDVVPEECVPVRINIRPLTSGWTGLCFMKLARSISESSESETYFI